MSEEQGTRDNGVKWLVAMLALVGLLLITTSFLLPTAWIFRRELIKELGIVVFAVFTVSLVYEAMLLKRHQDQFFALLRKQIAQGEDNAAKCEHLGIIQIFPRRDTFEMAHPFSEVTSALGSGQELCIIARSLFLVMTHPEALKVAIGRDSRIHLCVLNPALVTDEITRTSTLSASEIKAAIAVFKQEIAEWVKEASPPGEVILRFHNFPLLDSCLIDTSTVVWDLSFGRDLASKRIFLIDKARPLGHDLVRRYERVWTTATTIFEYADKRLVIDNLG